MSRLIVFLLLLVASIAWSADQAPAIALLANVAGLVRVRVEGDVDRSAVLMQHLPAGAELDLDIDAKASVFYPGSGTAFDLRGAGQFHVGAQESFAVGDALPPLRRPLNAAFRNIQLQRSHITQVGVVMRAVGGEARPQPLGPEGLVMSAERMVFRWSPVEGDGHYRFRLADTSGEPLFEAAVAGTELALPPTVALPNGRRLMWSVQAAGRLSPVRWANLIVADAATRRLAAELDRGSEPDSAAEHNLRALLLSQQALRTE